MLPLALLLFVVYSCEPYKILVVNPKMAYSHMNFMGKIADVLVDAGHDVVTLQPVLAPHPNNGTKRSRLIQVQPQQDLAPLVAKMLKDHESKWTDSVSNPILFLKGIPMIKEFFKAMARTLLNDDQLLQQLKSENFDVGITELFEFSGFPVFEAIGLKNIIGAHSMGLFEGSAYAIGVPVIPSYVPASLGITDDSSSFLTRVKSIVYTYLSYHFQNSAASGVDEVMFEKLGKSATPIWDSVSNMTWLLTNVDPLFDFAKPTLNKVVDIGGIGVHEAKPLEKNWNDVMNLRSRTILISFGSVLRSASMPEAYKQSVINLIKLNPDITFIWKYEEPESAVFADGLENLVMSKWTPQTDLLADDRLTLFVTHGGAGSLFESATYGKPLVVVPLFGDQVRNALLVEKFGFGMMLDKSNLKYVDALRNAVKTILEDNKYTVAARRIQNLLAKRPFSPEQKLVKTVELAAEFGHMPESLVAGRKLSFVAYHNLDIFLLFAGICLFTVFFLLYVAKRLLGIVNVKKIKAQ
ncbi:unnamed protein product [Cylicocyclus nassatus]|uniref:UDP-glucuronosyltransferase n=1 Tax=Cylicocyclus nassatus TaxID=53992 RepID=A0AA36H4R8_CYLNA|nr:unnamed protein product [Cylicocyclus nassatus]